MPSARPAWRLKPARERGYAMAALLVALGVMAVMMTVAMPVWKQMAQREKETELIFRGQQYARAIGLFQRRSGPGVLPPNVDVLVEQRLLRRKFKDPVTGDDFLLIPGAVAVGAQAQLQAAAGQAQARLQAAASQSRGLPASGRGGSSAAATPYVAQGGPFGTNVPGGVVGVVSKSTDASIRLYNGRGAYNEWEFRYTPPPAPPGPESGAPVGGSQRGLPPGVGADGPGGQRGRIGSPADGRGRGIGGDASRGGPGPLPGTGTGTGTGGRGSVPFGR